MSKTKNIYIVPVKKNDRTLIISDPKAHFGHLKHSLDFLLPIGTEIFAAKKGKVIDVKIDSKKGGFEKKYAGNKYLNFITIEHNKGEYSQYAHLKFKGSKVKVGEKVKTGQLIGYSGNTGFTTAPHLHFHVLKFNNSEIGWETLELKFNERIKVRRDDSDLSKKDKSILKKVSSQLK